MIRNTLTVIALTLTLAACSDSHDVTTTDIDVNVNTSASNSRHNNSYIGDMRWIDCDGFVSNMIMMHGEPSFFKTVHEERENFDLLTETSYYYADVELRFVVTEYRDGSCETFASDFHV